MECSWDSVTLVGGQILQLLEAISYKHVSWVGVGLCTNSPFSVVEYLLACAELVCYTLSSHISTLSYLENAVSLGSSTICGFYNIPIPSSAYISDILGGGGVLTKSSHLGLSAPRSHSVRCPVVGLLVPIHWKKQLLWWRQSDANIYGHSNMPLGVTLPPYSFSRIMVLAAIHKLQFTESPRSPERKLETHELRWGKKYMLIFTTFWQKYIPTFYYERR